MTSATGDIHCPAGRMSEEAAGQAQGESGRAPSCDYAEAKVWKALGGGWQCLHGCFCQGGVSVEWHDFLCAKPYEWSRSFHPDSLELCLNVTGHARLTDGDQSALFAPSTAGCYLAKPGRLSAWRLPGQRHRFLTIECSRGFLDRHLDAGRMAGHPALGWITRRKGQGKAISPIGRLTPALREQVDTLRQPRLTGPALGLWYQGQALAVIAEFVATLSQDEPPSNGRRNHVARERVERVVRFLGQRLDESPSLEELGRAVGCSPYHLSRTFSREMGMTIPQYRRQIRMERAAELLRSGKYNVTEVALEVGYSSLSHFSLAFCETIGCCPGLYPLGALPAASASSQPAEG